MLAGAALHIISRGNNRAACFFNDGDRLAYLRYLRTSLLRTGCVLHAYCLMTNHVHLLLTPPANLSACAALMKAVGQLYTQHVNRVHSRTGTLWEGRYRSCLASTSGYVTACYRYIELNPVRAGMVRHPGDYPWSSYRCNAEGRPDSFVLPHPAWESLGEDDEQRRRAYCSMLEVAVDDKLLNEIRSATRGNRELGAEPKSRGRPPKMGSVPIFG